MATQSNRRLNTVPNAPLDPELVKAAQEAGITPGELQSQINNIAYRKAYNKTRQEEQKKARLFVKNHPELEKLVNDRVQAKMSEGVGETGSGERKAA